MRFGFSANGGTKSYVHPIRPSRRSGSIGPSSLRAKAIGKGVSHRLPDRLRTDEETAVQSERRGQFSPVIKDYQDVQNRVGVLSYTILFLVWIVYFLLHLLMPGPMHSLSVLISFWVPGIEEMVKGRDGSGMIRVLVVTILLIMPFQLVYFIRTMIPRVDEENLDVREFLRKLWTVSFATLVAGTMFLTAWSILLPLPGEDRANLGSWGLLFEPFFRIDLFSGAFLLLGAYGFMQGVAYMVVFIRVVFFVLGRR
jgi:hypothetical protein